jgi:ABC-type transport system involved in multi-copper enzyme maturation permease subunit
MKVREGTWKNPVVVKYIRTRMRARRTFILVTAHLVFLGLVTGLAYFFFISSLPSPGALEQRRVFSKVVYGIIVGLEMILISFIAPAQTSSAITSERERQTFDLLRVTLLSARALVTGKYVSGIIFVFMLLFTALPFLSPAFMFGGVALVEILISIIILSVTALCFSAVGIFFSSLFKRTILATIVTYALAILFVFGIPLFAIIILAFFGDYLSSSGLNSPPITTQVTLLLVGWLIMAITPLATIIGTEVILVEFQSPFLATIPVGEQITLTLPSPWILYSAIYILASLILLLFSIRLVKRIEKM